MVRPRCDLLCLHQRRPQKERPDLRYQPSPHEGTADEGKAPGTLELFVEPNDGDLVDNADNLTVSPFGDLIVCEDAAGKTT